MRVGGGLLEMKMTTRVERTIKGKEDGEAESRERDWMKGCCGGRQTGVTEKKEEKKDRAYCLTHEWHTGPL